MDDLISLPCYSETSPLPFFSSSSSLPPPTDPSPTTLQHRLQYLLHASPEWWAYAIFWRPSPADHDGAPSPVLSWGGGHLRSARDAEAPMFGRRRAASGCPGALPDDVDAGATTDIEWFYVVSLTRSFSAGDAEDAVPTRALCSQAPIWLAGADALQASGCARASEALLHGVETLVCIPAGGGVLELGSPDLIPENWVLLQQANAILTVPDDAIIDLGGPTAALALPSQQTWESSAAAAAAAAAAGLSSSVDSGHLRPEKRQMVDKRPPKKSRGRKRRSGQITPMGHMEAERQRREKLNHLFCALRSVVPNVSRMDKASLLGDAVAYIKELRSRVGELEAGPGKAKSTAPDHNRSGGRRSTATSSVMRGGAAEKMELEVRMLGSDEAIILMQSENMEHPPARLMEALRDLEVVVHHASVSTVKESVVVQDVVVRVPRLQGGGTLKAALLARLEVDDDE